MGRSARILSLGLGLLLVVGDLPPLARAETLEPEIVLAQMEPRQRPGIFRFLFPDRRPRLVPMPVPAPPPQQARPRKKQQASRPRRERRKRSAAPAAPVVRAVEKAADAKRVMVVGDFMAGALAKGLNEAYEENANIVAIDASNGSSGLVRDDFYDWPAALPGLTAEQKPEVIVVLIGGNDRQPIAAASGSHDPGTEEWRAAYAGRVSAFADALAAAGKPVLWAGLPPVRQKAMARDYSAFNGIVREQLDSKELRFIETWNGFADEEGQFVAVGPDISGQSAQLRTDDGVNFTRAGQRKLAFFVEQDVNEILGVAMPVLAATAGDTAVMPEPGETLPSIGPMLPIEALTAGGTALSTLSPAAIALSGAGDAAAGSAPPLEPNDEASASTEGKNGPAASAGAKSGTAAAAIIARLAGGPDMAPPPGRADDYVWPFRAPRPAPAPREKPQAPAATSPAPSTSPQPR